MRASAAAAALAVVAVLHQLADDDVGVVVALLRPARNSPVRSSSAEMLGTQKVRNSANSSARVVSNGKSKQVLRKTMRW